LEGILAEEQVIKLLEEIRDLQKLHVENYKDALKNQQESLEIQRRAVRRQRISLLAISLVLLVFLGFIAWSSYSAK
jgi:CHASE3 domain sensor protein